MPNKNKRNNKESVRLSDTQIESIINKIREREQFATSDISIINVSGHTFRNGAMGAPEPGKMYTQALIQGYMIKVNIDDENVNFGVNQNLSRVVQQNNRLGHDIRPSRPAVPRPRCPK
ncbi:MAG: hypothetical protein HOI53_05355 [Francisellaceae bacterium]|jgi:hypothetical protein|nr:hypothetical protein [Francisellaceae bacterium]MBT6207433.1 hypothetical protein [Francisellaceae bacterium]MBT6538779.1 hypothetical protein [Francisellaceae bacterium]